MNSCLRLPTPASAREKVVGGRAASVTSGGAAGRRAVDNSGACGSVVAVLRFRQRLLAVCLMACWLVATQHCGLEASGWLELHAEADSSCCAGGEAHCSHDGCEIVEGGDYAANAAGKISPPLPTLCATLLVTSVQVPALKIISETWPAEFDRPLDWVATWRFVRRAAPSPRAPTLA